MSDFFKTPSQIKEEIQLGINDKKILGLKPKYILLGQQAYFSFKSEFKIPHNQEILYYLNLKIIIDSNIPYSGIGGSEKYKVEILC